MHTHDLKGNHPIQLATRLHDSPFVALCASCRGKLGPWLPKSASFCRRCLDCSRGGAQEELGGES